jgi:hypothetical protein
MSGHDTDDENWTYVDEIDQELSTGGLLLDLNGRQVLIGNFEVPGDYASAKVTPTRQRVDFLHRNSGTLDCDATILLILPCVHVSGVTGVGVGDDTGLGDEGVGEGGFAVVNCKTLSRAREDM